MVGTPGPWPPHPPAAASGEHPRHTVGAETGPMRHGCPLEAVACQDPEEEQRVEAEGDEGTPLPRCALALSGKRTGSTGTDSELNNLPDYEPPAARFRTCDRP